MICTCRNMCNKKNVSFTAEPCQTSKVLPFLKTCFTKSSILDLDGVLHSPLLLSTIVFITRSCYRCATDVLLPIPYWITKAIIVSIANNLSFIRLLLLVSEITLLPKDCQDVRIVKLTLFWGFYLYIQTTIFNFENLGIFAKFRF